MRIDTRGYVATGLQLNKPGEAPKPIPVAAGAQKYLAMHCLGATAFSNGNFILTDRRFFKTKPEVYASLWLWTKPQHCDLYEITVWVDGHAQPGERLMLPWNSAVVAVGDIFRARDAVKRLTGELPAP